jgi:hypothetical protein
LDADGNEIQPAKDKGVQVSCVAANVANENLSTEVYHVSENKSGKLSAEELKVKQEVTESTGEKSTATVKTDGFSYYQVEFTYDLKQYVLPGGGSAAMMYSLERLADLPVNYEIYPGHGESTTLAMEKQYNPYLRQHLL